MSTLLKRPSECLCIRLLSKFHLAVKIAIFGIFVVKFFDHLLAYALKICQQIYSKIINFPNQSEFRKKSIKACARTSNLSKAQVQEVLIELQKYHPDWTFEMTYLESKGDKDQSTSLRKMEKTDFFTKELDDLVLKGACDIAIHSAKDLPDPLPDGLEICAVTQGIDSSDSLVLNPGTTIDTLPNGTKIATSSLRREEAVKKLRSDCTFVDIRGTIEKRLEQLEKGLCDGVVVAEAALIRLGLAHLNRVKLPGDGAPLQGKLAIVSRGNFDIFDKLDTRKKVLNTGLSQKKSTPFEKIIHLPLIEIVPQKPDHPEIKTFFEKLKTCTHLIFTSKTSVSLFFEYLVHYKITNQEIKHIKFIAVGQSTKKMIECFGLPVFATAKNETAEGIVEEIENLDLKDSYFLFPHSRLSRPVIKKLFEKNNSPFYECVFYDTITRKQDTLPSMNAFDAIIFTSPSTIDAFIQVFGSLPKNKILRTQGPITQEYLSKRIL